MRTNFMKNRLKENLEQQGITLQGLSEILGITYQTLSKKMNGHVDFTKTEIQLMKDILGLTAEQIDYIFFQEKVIG